jgi:predicted GNAT family acetyltransferase
MPVTLHDNPTLSRFELDDDGVLAVANYRLADNVMTLTHTEVLPQARGHGLATQLVAGVLEAARARRLKVVAGCSFVRDFLVKHPEYHDLAPGAHPD